MVGGEYYIEENTKKLKIKEGNQYWVINKNKLEAIKIKSILNELNRGIEYTSGIYTWPWREDYPIVISKKRETPDFDTIEDF